MTRRRSHKRKHGHRPFCGSRFAADGRVWIEWTVRGVRHAKVIGANTAATREKADKILIGALELARGEAEGTVPAETLSLGRLLQLHRDDASQRTASRSGQPLRPATLERYDEYDTILRAAFGADADALTLRRPDDAGPAVSPRQRVKQFIRNAIEQGVGRGSVKRLVDHLRQVYRWAVAEELLDVDPIAGVKSPAHKPATVAYSRDEARRIYDALLRPRVDAVGRMMTGHEWRFRVVALTIVIYGVRDSQARGLRWSDVDLDALVDVEGTRYEGTVTFPKETRGSKGQDTRTLPLHPALRQALLVALNHRSEVGDFICWNQRAPAQPCDHEAMRRQLHALEVREGIARVAGKAWHSLRRSLMTSLVEELGVAQAAALTGDAPDVILRTYVKRSSEAVGEAIVAVGKLFPSKESRLNRDSAENAVVKVEATA